MIYWRIQNNFDHLGKLGLKYFQPEGNKSSFNIFLTKDILNSLANRQKALK